MKKLSVRGRTSSCYMSGRWLISAMLLWLLLLGSATNGGSLVTYLTTGDTPDPEQASRLPAVWVEDEDCDVGKDMALRNNKDLID